MTPQVISLSSLGSTAWIPVDYKQNPFNIGLACVVSNTPNLTYQVEFTLDDIFNTSITPTAFAHSLLVGKTSDFSSNQTVPVRAIRLTTTAYTSGTVTLTALQGGVNPTIYASNGGVMTSIGWLLSKNDVIDGLSTNTLLATTAPATHGSGIGRIERPLGTVGTNSDRSAGVDTTKGLPWVDDSGYVAGAARVTTLIGGYDHVCNQIAGTIVGGGHNYIQYHLDGHSVIVGGSNNRIAGGRGAIVGALNATITLDSNHGSVFGGRGGTVTNHFSAIVGGDANLVSGTYAFVGAGLTNSCGAHNAAILAGQTNTITVGATGACVAAGLSNSVGAAASYSLCSGRSNTVSHTLATVLGRDATSDADGALTIGKAKLLTVGDQQTTIHTMGIRTTDTTLTNLVTAMTPPAVKMAIGIRSAMVGIDEATGNSCMFTYDGLAQWNGSTQATFYDAGGSGTTRNFTQVVDNIGVAAVPHWAGNTELRPKVTGKLSTNIKWSCTAIFTVTRL